jgi:hypothetical protein
MKNKRKNSLEPAVPNLYVYKGKILVTETI